MLHPPRIPSISIPTKDMLCRLSLGVQGGKVEYEVEVPKVKGEIGVKRKQVEEVSTGVQRSVCKS